MHINILLKTQFNKKMESRYIGADLGFLKNKS